MNFIWSELLWLLPLVIFHEFGHYIWAKKEGIYAGFGLIPNPHIKLRMIYRNRWGYLSGLIGSILAVPLFIMFSICEIQWFFISAVTISVLDIIVVIFYNRLDRNKVFIYKNKPKYLKRGEL